MAYLTLIDEIDVLENDELVRKLALASLIVLLGILLLAPLTLILSHALHLRFSFVHVLNPALFVIVTALITLATFFVHELIHGIFFKIFNFNGSKIKFGFQSGMLYATAPGAQYPPCKFAVIIVAPFVCITALLVLLALFVSPLMAFVIFAFHTSGCVGDFYYLYRMFKQRGLIDMCEDTKTGVRFYRTKKMQK